MVIILFFFCFVLLLIRFIVACESACIFLYLTRTLMFPHIYAYEVFTQSYIRLLRLFKCTILYYYQKLSTKLESTNNINFIYNITISNLIFPNECVKYRYLYCLQLLSCLFSYIFSFSFCSMYCFMCVFGEGNRASRDYGLNTCYQIVVDMTDVDWFLLSLTKVT